MAAQAAAPAPLISLRPGHRPAAADSAAAGGTQLFLDVVQRGVADVLAVHHVDDVLADVLGVIADAFKGARDPDDVERPADRPRVFHHESDALALDRLELVVQHTVFAADPERRVRVEARERIEGIVHHLLREPAQVLDLAVAVGRPLHGREARGDVADLLGFVADALEVGDRLDDRDDQSQVGGGRGAGREDAAALLVNLHFHIVDLVVAARDLLAESAVAVDQRADRLRQLLFDETAHLQHAVAHTFEIVVEATRDVRSEFGHVHGRSRCRGGRAMRAVPAARPTDRRRAARARAILTQARRCRWTGSSVRAGAQRAGGPGQCLIEGSDVASWRTLAASAPRSGIRPRSTR